MSFLLFFSTREIVFLLIVLRQAISNIFKLLKANGTCLLAFLVSIPIFDIYIELSRMKKYSSFMKDVERFISPYHFEKNAALENFKGKLQNAGFEIRHIEIRDKIFIYDDVQVLKCKFLTIFYRRCSYCSTCFVVTSRCRESC